MTPLHEIDQNLRELGIEIADEPEPKPQPAPFKVPCMRQRPALDAWEVDSAKKLTSVTNCLASNRRTLKRITHEISHLLTTEELLSSLK